MEDRPGIRSIEMEGLHLRSERISLTLLWFLNRCNFSSATARRSNLCRVCCTSSPPRMPWLLASDVKILAENVSHGTREELVLDGRNSRIFVGAPRLSSVVRYARLMSWEKSCQGEREQKRMNIDKSFRDDFSSVFNNQRAPLDTTE